MAPFSSFETEVCGSFETELQGSFGTELQGSFGIEMQGSLATWPSQLSDSLRIELYGPLKLSYVAPWLLRPLGCQVL